MKEAIRTCGPRFSMRRMVIDYTQQYYMPAVTSGLRFRAMDLPWQSVWRRGKTASTPCGPPYASRPS